MGLGGTWWDVMGCGVRVWDFVGLRRTWWDVVGCGGMWRDVVGHWRLGTGQDLVSQLRQSLLFER